MYNIYYIIYVCVCVYTHRCMAHTPHILYSTQQNLVALRCMQMFLIQHHILYFSELWWWLLLLLLFETGSYYVDLASLELTT